MSISRSIPHTTLLVLCRTYDVLQYKRKIHTRKELIQAQELGEILAIGYNRYVNNKWEEKDREVSFGLLLLANRIRSI